MATTTVHGGSGGGQPFGSVEANPLGLSLGFIEGMALVSLRDRAIADGVMVRALDLELADVSFPLDLAGGAEEFQRRSTKLRTLVLELDVAAFARFLQEGLSAVASPIRKLELRVEHGVIALEAELVLQDRRSRLAAQLVLTPSEPREVKLVLSDVLELGYFPLSALSLPDQLEGAVRHLLDKFGERAVETLHRAGAGSIALDAVGALLFALFPRSGWKLPQHEDVPIHRLELSEKTIRLELGDLSSVGAREASKVPDAVLRALAKDDAGGVAAPAEKLLDAGDLVAAFSEMRARLDASGGPEVLVERLLSLGSSDPRLFAEASDLANDQLRKRPDSVPALLAKARIATYEGQAGAAFAGFEKTAKVLRESGRRRQAGFAYIAASRAAKRETPERARVLEEAIALLPDDIEALSGLVEELPQLGRASAAVRAARRLASLADTNDTRVRAHTIAGDLLRGPLADPVQAKREYERALKVSPDDALALEGLARAVMDGGEPRRAATIFEKLIARAEAEGDSPRASRMSLVLGELWRPLDAEAAMVRFRRAYELDPKNLGALAKLAEAAALAGRPEAALDAVEQVLPLAEGQDAPELLDLRLRAGSLLAKDPKRVLEAIGHFESALRIDPKNLEAYAALNAILEHAHDPAKHRSLNRRWAEVLVERGELDAAAPRFRDWSVFSSSDFAELKQARQAVLDALKKDRRSRALLDVLIEISEKTGEAADTIDAVDRRLLLDDEPQVRAGLLERFGVALERAGRTSDAVRAYEEAIAKHPNSAAAIAALVRIYRAKDDFDRLAAALERAAGITNRDTQRAAFLQERAKLLASLGRDSEAFDAVSRSLEASPGSNDAELLPLATALAIRTGRFAEARAFASRRLKAAEKEPPETRLGIHLDLARAAEGMGERDALIAELHRALALAHPISDSARTIAARLVRELYLANRFEELAGVHRQLAEEPTAAGAERAERLIEAGRLASRIQQKRVAEDDARKALTILDATRPHDAKGRRAHAELEQAGLDLLEALVREDGNARQLAEVLGRRARAAETTKERERLRLDQARVLEEGALDVLAVQALEEAADELPQSIDIARALGEAAERAGQLSVTASSYGRAARLAESIAREDLAIEMHGRAAQACASLGDAAYAVTHDRALLSLCPPGSASSWLGKAIDRLEKHARTEGDHLLLVEVLSRRAATAAPSFAARLLLEKATTESELLKNDKAALDSLKRARALAPEGSEAAEAIEERLVATLERLAMHSEQAVVLVERAERAKSAERQAGFYFEAARLYAGPLGDRSMALSRAQAAIRAFSGHEGSRELRLRLLREGGRREALVDALEDEASMSKNANDAARLWVEAAEILLPNVRLADEDAAARPSRVDLERGIDLVRRAATAAPRAPAPLRAASLYTRVLGKADEEFVALEQLIERDVPDEERVAAYLRRVDLLRGPLEDATAAQQELDVALAVIDDLDQEARDRVIELLPSRTAIYFELLTRPLAIGVLRAGIELAADNSDWQNHVRLLLELVDLSEDVKQRADLRVNAGEVLEWKLGDGAAAEREYRAALALDPAHDRAREALKSFYIGGDRYADLAENLGVDALRAVWKKVRDVEAPPRVLAAGEALWPVLPKDSDERAEVQLTIADLYITAKDDAAQAVHVLEQVIRDANKPYQSRALERLSVLFLEQERYDLYVEVLRRQAERVEDDKQRARALTELGEALEWKLGDGVAAEREYRTALAIDSTCEEAREKLGLFLASQDRFDEMGRDLGPQVLAEELDRLVRTGEREEQRAWRAASSLADVVEADRRATIWLRFAERAKGTANERPALEKAALEGTATEQAKALDRLIALLEAHHDSRALVNVLRRRVLLESGHDEQLALHYRLGALLHEMIPEADEAGRDALVAEAETELRAALALDADHVGVRLLLESLYVSEGRLVELGRVLGTETLRAIRTRAEEQGPNALLERAIDALAELSSGDERAQLLVQLVELIADGRDPLRKWTPESLYQAALSSHGTNTQAREGLRALYESEGRYKDIAHVLGPDALRETLEQLRRLEDQSALLPASLALAHALSTIVGTERERAELSLDIAELHFYDGDSEAGEHALWMAFELASDHPRARRELRALMTRQSRLAELAETDETLVTEAAQEAARAGELPVEIAALTVLAGRRQDDARADTLVLIAALEMKRKGAAAAEAALREALSVSPEHALARGELEQMLWASARYEELLQALGAKTLLQRAKSAAALDRTTAVAALEILLATPELDASLAAQALELSASLMVVPDEKLGELERAKTIWDALGDDPGRERVRLSIAAVYRAKGDDEQLIDALQEAGEFARTHATRAALSIERATLLVLAARKDEARALIEPLVEDQDAPIAERRAAARIFVDDLGEGDLELRISALELLTEEDGHDRLVATGGPALPDRDPKYGHRPGLDRWLIQLAAAREELGADDHALTKPLERALSMLTDRGQEPSIRGKLRELYEQSGDWRRAESHAAVIAEVENKASAWVSLSELREWLDDPAGAKSALERALSIDPAQDAANRALIRLAERDGDQQTVIERLSTWAKEDQSAPKRERALRLLRAARMSADAGDAARAADHAERAFELLDRDDDVHQLALDACAILEPLGQRAAMAAILSRAVSLSSRSADLRIRLADLLISLDRRDEASTVIELGIHRLIAEDDPLIERFLAETKPLADEAAARRLLALADRLGVGPAARRLRLEGAQRAEKAGQNAIAANAWSTIAAEVGGAESEIARKSILRLARASEDQPTLITALIGAAEEEQSPTERASLLGEAADRADRAGDAERAEALLRRAIAADPANDWLRDRLLELFQERGRFALLDEELTARAESKTGDEKAALYDRAAKNAIDNLRDHLRGGHAYSRAHEAEPSLERGMGASRAFLAAGRAQDAADWAQRVEREHAPANPRALFEAQLLYAEALEASGAIDAAIEAMLAARNGQPDSELAEARLFDLLARCKRWSELAGVLDRFADRVDPAMGLRSRLASAHLYIQELDDRDSAREVLIRALDLGDRWLNDPEATIPDQLARDPSAPLLDLAAMAHELGAHQQRIDALRLRTQSLPVGPEQWRALFALATAEREASDLDASEYTLRGVVDVVRRGDSVAPADRAEAELALGALLLDRKDADGAAAALARAVEILRADGAEGAAQEIRALVQLAQAERARGAHDHALSALIDAHALDSTAVAEVDLEAAIEAAGPSKKLAELFERRAAHSDHSATAARHERSAAEVYERIGDRARSIEPRLRAYRLDPSNRTEAVELGEKLYRAERWADLAQQQSVRLELEDLTDVERVMVLLARAELLAHRLDRGEEAMTLLYEARDLMPKSRDVLFALADLALERGLDDVRADSLARLATVERSLERRQALLSERAALLERADDIAGAAQALEEAVDVAFQRAKEAALSAELLPLPRALVERLAGLYGKRGHFASAARLWVRVAEAASGSEAAAALSRAGHIRLEALGDRRGAMAALEAAARQNTSDLGIRRALIELASTLGDTHKVRMHARAGIDAAKKIGEREALFAFTLEDARNSAKMKDGHALHTAWLALLELSPEHPRLLDHFVAQAREAGVAEQLMKILNERIRGMTPGPIRGRYRLANARLLEDPLERQWEAQGEREAAEREDFSRASNGHARDGKTPLLFASVSPEATADIEDEYRASRSTLDRTGRFAELASLEERRAAVLVDPVARSSALVEVGRLHTEKGAENPQRARDAFVRAVRAFPDNVDALARLARLEVEQGEHERALVVFERLERLGGPPWPVPQFELLGADVARSAGHAALEKVRLLRARDRDPASTEVLARLAELSEGEGWLDAYEATIDPMTGTKELAQVCEWRARLYERIGKSSEALEEIARALELDPLRESASALRRLMLEARPPSRALVDVLISEATAKDRESALATLVYALGIAETNADVPRMMEIASDLEGIAAPSDAVWPRIIKLLAEHGDGEALLRIADRLGGITKLGELEEESRIRLARAALAQGRAYDTTSLLVSFLGEPARFAHAAARVLGDADATTAASPARVLRAPRALQRLKSMLLQLGRDPAEVRAMIALLEALYALLPNERSVARRLARAYREHQEHLPRAMVIVRGLLEEDPLDPELVTDLLDTATALSDPAAAAGPRAIAQLFAAEPALIPPLSPIAARPSEEALAGDIRHPDAKTPLGELLRRTSQAIAGVLPPPALKDRRRAADDPRLADLARDVRALFDFDFEMTIDPDGGHRVSIEPGDPPSVVIGEALVDDATAPELRFHLARAATLLELGYAIVDRTAGKERRKMIDLIIAACDPDSSVRVAPDLGDAIDRVREKLGAAGLAACEPHASVVKSADVPIAGWMYGAVTTANRFALLAAGDLRAAILALRRTDPRSFGEKFDTREARLRALRRSSSLIDLLRFAVSGSFARMRAAADRVGADATARFPI